MNRISSSLALAGFAASAALLSSYERSPVETECTGPTADQTSVPGAVDLGRLPLTFVENCGQWDARARFRARSGPMHAWVVDDGWLLQVEQAESDGQHVRGVAVGMHFESTRPGVRPRGIETLPGTHNFMLGADPRRFATGVSGHARLRFPELYDGVDVVLREEQGTIEYDVVLAPGADLSQVSVRCEGVEELRVDPDGALVLATSLGDIRQTPPRTWSTDSRGQRHAVACRYVLRDRHRFGFQVEGWNGDEELCIDPGLVWSTYLGGGADDTVFAVDVAPNGDVVVAGITSSAGFPATVGAFQQSYRGTTSGQGLGDAFVARLSPDGTRLVFATFLGGSAGEFARSVHVDSTGIITVAGQTLSTDFPTTPNALNATGNNSELFAARLDATGSTLLYSTRFGGLRFNGIGGIDRIGGLAVDEARGWIYLTGRTDSNTTTNRFRITANAFSTTRSGSSDAFLTVLDVQSDPTRTILVYSSYFGGTGATSWISGPDVDAAGVVTFAGVESGGGLPTTPGALLTQRPSTSRYGFVVQLDPAQAGTAGLVYGTYLGGSGNEGRMMAVVQANGHIGLAGTTASADYPVTQGAYQTQLAGSSDPFLTVLDPAQTGSGQLVYSSYLGGGGNTDDVVTALDVDGQGIFTLVGYTTSGSFPTTLGAFQTRPSGIGRRGFLSRIDPSQTGAQALLYSTLFRGCGGATQIQAVRVDAAANVATIAGRTTATAFPVTQGVIQGNRAGSSSNEDGFVTRLELTPEPDIAFGTSCAGTLGTPALVPSQPANLCLRHEIRLQGARPNQLAFFLLGFSRTALGGLPLPMPLGPFGMTGCALYVSDDVMFVRTTGSGATNFGFTLPSRPDLVGLEFYEQCFFVDPGANSVGMVSTNAVQSVVRF